MTPVSPRATAPLRALLAAAILALLPAAARAEEDPTAAARLPVDTSAAIAAAGWAETVTITLDPEARTFRFQSNGIPSHGFAEKYLIPKNVGSMPFADNGADEFNVVTSADYFSETPVDTTITTRPSYVDAVTDTSLGRIGVALSGAQLFNDYENPQRSITAMDDNVIHDDVPFVDQCNGHTLVDGSNYHYHGIPACITASLDRQGEHSRLLGVLEDGFPVYGNRGEGGVTITDAELDACSGHFGVTPEFSEGIYHYHLTADEAPYMVDCYHGAVGEILSNANPAIGGGGPDLAAAAAALNVSEAALEAALGTSMPPDFEAAAAALGVSLQELRAALPGPGGPGGPGGGGPAPAD